MFPLIFLDGVARRQKQPDREGCADASDQSGKDPSADGALCRDDKSAVH